MSLRLLKTNVIDLWQLHRIDSKVPVEESLYSGMGAVAGGLVWLKSRVTGVLGEGSADPDDDPTSSSRNHRANTTGVGWS